jgi:hypothetical protein
MPFACVAAHHRFIATVALSFVGRVAMRLEGLIAAACSFTAQGSKSILLVIVPEPLVIR